MFASLVQDLRFALRQYRSRPGFALLAILALAFGIGAATAVYSVVHAVLLRPLPFADAGRLMMVWDNAPQDGDRFRAIMVSREDLDEYTRSSRFLDRFSSAGRIRPLLQYGGVARRTLAGLVTVAMFRDTLGSEARLGRTFLASDQETGCVVVLAHRFWTRVLGEDASLVGRALTFDETQCTVLGVMPLGFDLFPIEADMWFLRDHAPVRGGGPTDGIVYARLKPGATPQQAETELTALHRALHANDPSEEKDRVAAVTPVRSAIASVTSPSLDASLWLAFGAVVLLLSIACVNVANLLLARLADRQRELVVCAALGSGRARLIRQMLAEGALLAAAGTGLGIGLAWAGVHWFRWLNPLDLPVQAGEVGVNLRVLLFAAALSVATTLLFTLLPAMTGSRIDLSQGLRAAGRGFVGFAGRRHTAQVMVAVEMALSFVLLAGAGLLMSSVLRLEQEPLGYDVAGIAAAYGDLPPDRYPTQESRDAFQRALRERLEQLPGVASVAFGSFPPDTGGDLQMEVQGRPVEPVFDVAVQTANREYFEMLRVPLLRGRMFEDADRTGPAVAIVSQRFVDEYLKGSEPLGRSIRVRNGDQIGEWKIVVGVVGTWKHMVNDTAWRDTPVVFTTRMPGAEYGVGVGVRTSGDTRVLAREVQRQIAELEPNAILQDPVPPSETLAKMLAYPRFRAILLMGFGAGALLLAAVGLYGVVAQSVAQRMPEFGVRRAVGAQARDLAWLVARRGGMAVLVGLGAGAAVALAAGQLVKSMLFGVGVHDPSVWFGAALVLLFAALVAMTLPARRAARVDPMVALKME